MDHRKEKAIMSDTDAELARRLEAGTLNVAILLFPNVEVLDFAGPFEVFSVASRIARDRPHPPFRVSTVAEERMPVAARHGLPVIANFTIEEWLPVDLLIVPGGIVDQPLSDPATLAWLEATSKQAALTASVCTGAFLLARLGLLAGRRVTTHWEDIPALRAAHPDLNVVEDVPYVDAGAIVTSAGISAGIDMSLHLVGRVLGLPAARGTARQMQYDWKAFREAA
jgi:transcriptional regulator GlxA family with amidase domain